CHLAGGFDRVPGRTDELEPDGLAAITVREQRLRACGAGRVAVAPLHQRDEHGIKVQALVGQPVLVTAALPMLLVRDLPQQALVHQPRQPVAQDLPGRLGAALHVVEAADPVEHLAQYEEGPLLADDAHGRADRAVGAVVVEDPGPSHARMLSPVDRLSNPGGSWVCEANPGTEACGARLACHARFAWRAREASLGGMGALAGPCVPAGL